MTQSIAASRLRSDSDQPPSGPIRIAQGPRGRPDSTCAGPAMDFIHENCIGCGYCVTGCPFDIPRISQKTHVSYKCTLCSDRVAVGQG
ncbi:4Fe-4S dicluster domain-containing protein, partial [Paracoccus sp. APAP_BH8]|uniref:4Fe-4S dicluster domain-containing protein n=1 Tax=Paracoccus sp. APAP_BH8 TaxID=3110237 RepID=UPI002FD82257